MSADVHPTGTAGSGREIYSRRGSPSDAPEDRVECAQCGFHVSLRRDTQGDGDSNGIEIRDVTYSVANTQANLPIHLRDVSSFLVSSVAKKEPFVTSGCPFCGSFNSRGVGRDRDPFLKSRDVSGL